MLWSWGVGTQGQLGNGAYRERQGAPREVSLPRQISGFVSLASADHNLLVGADGGVLVWGGGEHGQLGVSDDQDDPELSEPTRLPLGEGVVSGSCGQKHSVVATTAGRVLSCGSGSKGQLGHGNSVSGMLWRPRAVEGLTGNLIQLVACGWNHTLALGVDGATYAWGDGTFGQLGTGGRSSTWAPANVKLPAGGALNVSAGGNHSAAIGADGRLHTWGMNCSGQLGVGSTRTCVSPMAAEIEPCKAVACGYRHSLAITCNGDLKAWGNGGSGQLGLGGLTGLNAVSVPQFVPALRALEAVCVACGKDNSACVLSDGRLYTWGDGTCGSLGLGINHFPKVDEPQVVPGLHGRIITYVSCGVSHMLATSAVPVAGCVMPGRAPDASLLQRWAAEAEARGILKSPWADGETYHPVVTGESLRRSQLSQPRPSLVEALSQQHSQPRLHSWSRELDARGVSSSASPPSTFDQLDTNKDGVVDRREWMAAHSDEPVNSVEVESLKMELSNQQQATLHERRQAEMRLHHLQSEAKLQLQIELDKTLDIERGQLEAKHQAALSELRAEHQSAVSREASEKERAWAAYNMLRKVVEQEKRAKSAQEQQLLNEQKQCEQHQAEIDEMRREVQRLHEKMIAAYQAKDDSQAAMIEQSALNGQLAMQSTHQTALLDCMKRRAVERVFASFDCLLTQHCFRGWMLCCRHPRVTRVLLEDKLEEQEMWHDQLLEAAEADKKCLAMEASYQSFLAKQMSSTINHLEEARRTLLVQSRDGNFQARLSGAQQLSSRFDRWRDGSVHHIMSKWKTARAVSIMHQGSVRALAEAETRREELLAALDAAQLELQQLKEKLFAASESDRAVGLHVMTRWVRDQNMIRASNALLQWRSAIAAENEMWWQASRSEEIRLRTLLRGHGSISGAAAVRLLAKSWSKLSIGRSFGSWRLNYLVDDAFMTSAKSHTEIFYAARQEQSIEGLKAFLWRERARRLGKCVQRFREGMQANRAHAQSTFEGLVALETARKKLGLKMVRRVLNKMKSGVMQQQLMNFKANMSTDAALLRLNQEKGKQLSAELRDASRSSSVRLLAAVQRRWARFPLQAAVASWKESYQSAVITMRMEFENTQRVFAMLQQGKHQAASLLMRESLTKLHRQSAQAAISTWVWRVRSSQHHANSDMAAAEMAQRLAECEVMAAQRCRSEQVTGNHGRGVVLLKGRIKALILQSQMSALRSWQQELMLSKTSTKLVMDHMHDLRHQIIQVHRREAVRKMRFISWHILGSRAHSSLRNWAHAKQTAWLRRLEGQLSGQVQQLHSDYDKVSAQSKSQAHAAALKKLRFLCLSWNQQVMLSVLSKFQKNAGCGLQANMASKTSAAKQLLTFMLKPIEARLSTAYREWQLVTALSAHERQLQSVLKLAVDSQKRKTLGVRAERNMAVYSMWCSVWQLSAFGDWRMWASNKRAVERSSLKDAMVKHQIYSARKDAGLRSIKMIMAKFNAFHVSSRIANWKLSMGMIQQCAHSQASLQASEQAKLRALGEARQQGGMRMLRDVFKKKLHGKLAVVFGNMKLHFDAFKMRELLRNRERYGEKLSAMKHIGQLMLSWQSQRLQAAFLSMLQAFTIHKRIYGSRSVAALQRMNQVIKKWQQVGVCRVFVQLRSSWLKHSALNALTRSSAKQLTQSFRGGGLQALSFVIKRIQNASKFAALSSMRRSWVVAVTTARLVREGSNRVERTLLQANQSTALFNLSAMLAGWDTAAKRKAVRSLQCIRSQSSVDRDRKDTAVQQFVTFLHRGFRKECVRALGCWSSNAKCARTGQVQMALGSRRSRGVLAFSQVLSCAVKMTLLSVTRRMRENWRVAKKNAELLQTQDVVEQMIKDFEADSAHWEKMQGQLQTQKLRGAFQNTLYQWRVLISMAMARAFHSWTQLVASKDWAEPGPVVELHDAVAELEVKMVRSDRDKQALIKMIDRMSRDLETLMERQ